MACIFLHIFLSRKSRTSSTRYSPRGSFDIENKDELIPGSWRNESNDNITSMVPIHKIPRKPGDEAKKFGIYSLSIWQLTGKYRGKMPNVTLPRQAVSRM